MRIYLIAFIVVLCLMVTSCLNDKADDFNPNCDSTYFADSIRPIYITNCYDPDNNGACHNEEAASVRGNFSVYDAAQDGIFSRIDEMKIRLNLPLTNPDHMPLARVLTTNDLNRLNNWLDAGAPYCKP